MRVKRKHSMDKAHRIAWRKRLLAATVAAALALGVAGVGSTAALAQTTEEVGTTQADPTTGDAEATTPGEETTGEPGNTGAENGAGTGNSTDTESKAKPGADPEPETNTPQESPSPEAPETEGTEDAALEGETLSKLLTGQPVDLAAPAETAAAVPTAEPYATGTCPAISAQEYGFGKGTSLTRGREPCWATTVCRQTSAPATSTLRISRCRPQPQLRRQRATTAQH